MLENPFIVMNGQPNLVQVILALRPCGSFPDFLHRRYHKRDQNANNRDNHEDLNQSKGGAPLRARADRHRSTSS